MLTPSYFLVKFHCIGFNLSLLLFVNHQIFPSYLLFAPSSSPYQTNLGKVSNPGTHQENDVLFLGSTERLTVSVLAVEARNFQPPLNTQV